MALVDTIEAAIRASFELVIGDKIRTSVRKGMEGQDIWIQASDGISEYKGEARESDIQKAIITSIEVSESGWDDMSEVIAAISTVMGAPEYEVATLTTTGSVPADDYMIEADSTIGVMTLTLPSLSTVSLGKAYVVMRTAGINLVTIDTFGADLINGVTSVTLPAVYDSVRLVAGTTEWLKY